MFINVDSHIKTNAMDDTHTHAHKTVAKKDDSKLKVNVSSAERKKNAQLPELRHQKHPTSGQLILLLASNTFDYLIHSHTY